MVHNPRLRHTVDHLFPPRRHPATVSRHAAVMALEGHRARRSPMKRLLLLSLLVALLALPGALPAAANSSSGAGGRLSELRPPEGQELVLTAIGMGSQNYVCDKA